MKAVKDLNKAFCNLGATLAKAFEADYGRRVRKSFSERIISCSKGHQSRVVLALDLIRNNEIKLRRDAKEIVEGLGPYIAAVKLNFHLLLPMSLSSIKDVLKVCSNESLLAIADIKLNDVDSTNKVATSYLWRAGFDAVIANPIAGYDGGLRESIAEARRLGKGFLFLVYMSHPGAKTFYGLTLRRGVQLCDVFAEKASEWGADGVVVGATQPRIISRVRKFIPKLLIFAPGVGVQGGTGKETVEAGADFVIVGRSIINASNPLDSARRICQETWDPWKGYE